jgi:hypothetical protein
LSPSNTFDTLSVTLSLEAGVFALEAGFGKARNVDPNLDWGSAIDIFFNWDAGLKSVFISRSGLNSYSRSLSTKNEYDQGVSSFFLDLAVY